MPTAKLDGKVTPNGRERKHRAAADAKLEMQQPAAMPEAQLSQQRRVEAAAKLFCGASSSSLGTLQKEAVPQAQTPSGMPQAQTPSWRWRHPAATPEEELQRRVEAAAKLLRGVKQQSRNITKRGATGPDAKRDAAGPDAKLEMEAPSGDARRRVAEASGSCSEAFEGGQAAVSEH